MNYLSMKTLTHSPWLWGGVLVILAIAFQVAGFLHSRGGPGDYAGAVVSVSATALTVREGNDTMRSFTFASTTDIHAGPTKITASDIAVGRFVVVRESRTRPGTLEEIRLLKDDHPFPGSR